jgi:chorismate dehydratase
MKIGIVKHLNARPLTFGIECCGKYRLVYDNPSVLKDLLVQGELDAALISSVECVRCSDQLDYYTEVGVCVHNKVRSILFFKNKQEAFLPSTISVDSGSRSSVALLRVLLNMQTGKPVETVAKAPQDILSDMSRGVGSHLLFGDNALLAKPNLLYYEVIDLAEWWHRTTGLGFCFAFWAFPKTKKVSLRLFQESLEYGLANIESIISQETRLPKELTEKYLKEELHYHTQEADLQGFHFFVKQLATLENRLKVQGE